VSGNASQLVIFEVAGYINSLRKEQP
jgi:hypothetical protein